MLRRSHAGIAFGQVILAAMTACGGGSSSATPSPSASPTPTAAPATPAPTATPTPAPRPLELTAPSVSVDVVATSVPCDMSLLSLLPTGSTVDYANCGGYVVFLAAAGGPLDPIVRSPGGTAVRWLDEGGMPFHTSLTGDTATLDRDPSSGEYGGHGVGGPTIFIQSRDMSQAKERSGPIQMG